MNDSTTHTSVTPNDPADLDQIATAVACLAHKRKRGDAMPSYVLRCAMLCDAAPNNAMLCYLIRLTHAMICSAVATRCV